MMTMVSVTSNLLGLSSDTAGFIASNLRPYRNPPGIVSLAQEQHVGNGGAASDSETSSHPVFRVRVGQP